MNPESQNQKDERRNEKRSFRIEKLEERIAPKMQGTGGYEGQPGNQNSAHGNPSGSANPEH